MNLEVLPPAERRDIVRRLIALCHIVNDLVEITATTPADGGPDPDALHEHAQQIQTVVRDIVVDLVANGRQSDAA
ncbi:hypothetical protein ACWDO0_27305 [Nocardia rhamnosiphila]|uniref:Uncharacterized protein n=1 Tax=Nocardia rhamnosiphila TaxID=426716 RepID=A0ABV2WLB5_9NOCA|nr:hypothetical protein [Nocardia rhamnosiphila]